MRGSGSAAPSTITGTPFSWQTAQKVGKIDQSALHRVMRDHVERRGGLRTDRACKLISAALGRGADLDDLRAGERDVLRRRGRHR